jgi:hypothetical protein
MPGSKDQGSDRDRSHLAADPSQSIVINRRPSSPSRQVLDLGATSVSSRQVVEPVNIRDGEGLPASKACRLQGCHGSTILVCSGREAQVRLVTSGKSGKRGSQFEHESPRGAKTSHDELGKFCYLHRRDEAVICLQCLRNIKILKGLGREVVAGKEASGWVESIFSPRMPLGPKVAIYSSVRRFAWDAILRLGSVHQSPELGLATFRSLQ